MDECEDLEDGEIETSDSEDVYKPLKRPENYSESTSNQAQNNVENESESGDSNSEISGNSDSESSVGQSKKPRIKLKPVKKLMKKKNEKYKIWNEKIQEDLLTESLNTCDVTNKDRCRDVESYDYVFSARYHEMLNGDDKNDRKRSRADRNNSEVKKSVRKNESKGLCRKILDLTTTVENSIEEIAKDISNKLYEEKEDLILKVIQTVGKEKCIETFKKTQEIESDGGLLILNCARRRTPGGVFLYTLRMDDSVSREDKNKMFNEERNGARKKIKEQRKRKNEQLKKQTAEERMKLYPELMNNSKNPPPSPEPSEMKLTTYDDDFLDLNCPNIEMEMF